MSQWSEVSTALSFWPGFPSSAVGGASGQTLGIEATMGGKGWIQISTETIQSKGHIWCVKKATKNNNLSNNDISGYPPQFSSGNQRRLDGLMRDDLVFLRSLFYMHTFAVTEIA
jgi:hypothetical protein